MEKSERSQPHDFYHKKTTISKVHRIYSEFRIVAESILKFDELARDSSLGIPETSLNSLDILFAEFTLNLKKAFKRSIEDLIGEVAKLGSEKKIENTLGECFEDLTSKYFILTQNEHKIIEKPDLEEDLRKLGHQLNSYSFEPLTQRDDVEGDKEGEEFVYTHREEDNDEEGGFAIPQKSTLEGFGQQEGKQGAELDYSNPYLHPSSVRTIGTF